MGFDFIKKENSEISYELIYTKRKSVGIYITATGEVTVHAPLRMKKSTIREIVSRKSDWILTTQKRCLENKTQNVEKSYQTGTVLPYLGKMYALQILSSEKTNRDSIWKEEEHILIKTTNLEYSHIRDCLEVFYRNEAKKVLADKVASISKKMGVWYGRITIKNQKTRWGSCSSKGNLNFNWRILMAPEAIVDYLVVHELAHRKEMNHSRAFYQLVEKYFPDYKNAQKWLKDNGKNLNL